MAVSLFLVPESLQITAIDSEDTESFQLLNYTELINLTCQVESGTILTVNFNS